MREERRAWLVTLPLRRDDPELRAWMLVLLPPASVQLRLEQRRRLELGWDRLICDVQAIGSIPDSQPVA